jgi:DNA-binding transcriptional MerR regulator
MAVQSQIKKLYYTIKEVADMFSVSESALRNWERDFPNLNPKRSSSGDRKYTEKDIKEVRLIVSVRKEKRLTVEGAKNYIQAKEYKKSENEELLNSLNKIRSFLMEMKNSIDTDSN